MEKIKPSVDTTKEELRDRIDYMMSEKTRIEELSKVNTKQAIADFRVLRRFANDEWHELTLARNEEACMHNQALASYKSFFTHLHLQSGRVNKENLHWNLDEFDQANGGFEL
ncbi:hypothetical protein L1O48_02405 [Ligilactobacillus equi]|uniref:hypothetical protein n=1 Tax=Ligilactobacillus equi TaxID=137357 RepID=UPI002ED524A9